MSLEEAIKFLRQRTGYLDWGDERLADKLECSVDIAHEAKQTVKNENKPNKDNTGTYDEYDKKENHDNENKNRGYDTPTAMRDQSLEEYCKSIGIDPDKIDKYNDVKYWTDAAGNRRYSIVPKKLNDEDFDPEKAFREAISEYTPPSYTANLNSAPTPKSRLAVLNLFDAHLDKISSVDVTDKARTVQDNVDLFEEAFEELLEGVAVKKPEKIVIPLGNDFWHTNDDSNSTKKGTYLGSSVGMKNMDSFRLGMNVIRRCIDKARQVAPVELVAVRGNHDNDKVLYMLECLLIAYENQEDVKVKDSRRSRQYIRYGTWLFGWAHGDKQRKAKELPSLMSTDEESRKHWSDVTRGVYFLGDIHHERRYDYRGCTVMYLRSTSTTDEWHWNHGFTAIPKTAYGFVFDKDGKREYEFKVNV